MDGGGGNAGGGNAGGNGGGNGGGNDGGSGGGPYPETLAALETARKLQMEKMQIEAAAKQREQQLLQTIRQQQQLLDQLQQAAASAEKRTQVSRSFPSSPIPLDSNRVVMDRYES